MDHLFVKPWFDKNIPMTRGKCYWLFNEWKRKSFGVGRGERVGVREQWQRVLFTHEKSIRHDK